MNSTIRFVKNIYYIFKRVRIIDESVSKFFILCLSCSSTSEIHKNYGVMVFVCKCGHRTKIYTGKNFHQIINKKNYENKPKLSEDDIIAEKRRDKYEIFHKHIKRDLESLYNHISDKHNVTIQVDRTNCLNILKGNDLKSEYEDVLKYLKSFLNLHSTPINLTWDPLNKQNTLSDTQHQINIMGTTYPLRMGSIVFYTIYLNPNLLNEKVTLLMVLSHELCHVYSDTNNIKFISPDNDRGNKEYSEQMTDLLGVVLGMGKLMYTSKSDEGSFNTGYLTDNMVRESCELWDSEFLSGKNMIVKLLAKCSVCNQKLRIPIKRDGFRIVCPKCKTEYKPN